MSKEIVSEPLDIPTWFLSEEAIGRLARQKPGSANAAAALAARARELLDERAESVMDKAPTPPTGDKHDYMSLAIYVWPNPEMPDGLPYIHKDGVINPEIHEYDLPRLSRMVVRVETLALAALREGEKAFADKAAALMRVWFLDEATRMNPHLDFGQFVPGECDGRCYGIIETTGLLRVANAVRMLEAIDGYAYGDGAAMRAWFRRYADWLTGSELGVAEGRTANNHRVWHVAQAAGCRLFCGEVAAARQLLEREIPDILAQQMDPDGSMPRELGRTRSFHYTSFVLVPLLMCAEMGKTLGLDLTAATTSDGASVATGMAWFLPYLSGEREWTWTQIYPEDPRQDVYPLLRMAANVLNAPAYEAALQQAAGDDYDDLAQNLILPATKV